MNNIKITCRCGHYITLQNDLYRLSFYKLKKPLENKTEKNERIIEEVFYSFVCPECGADVVLIKRKARNAAGGIKVLLPIKLIGIKAEEYLLQTENNRINKTNELKYAEYGASVKGIPLSYGKVINGMVQRPRYINEAGYSGARIENKIKVYK